MKPYLDSENACTSSISIEAGIDSDLIDLILVLLTP